MASNPSSRHDWVAAGVPDLFSIVIPTCNEAENLEVVVPKLVSELERAGIDHEILVVNDGSTDGSRDVLVELAARYHQVRFIDNPAPNGFGLAVHAGLANFRGDAVAIVMADGSDSPADLVKYRAKLQEGYDCVFGSRFISGSKVIDYPIHKLILNRLANLFIRVIFQIRYNDVTNAFKSYRREVIAGLEPILAHHFNLTVELPLKAIIRGYTFTVIPISWTNRASGVSKLKIREMGSRYLFIVIYCFIERLLSRGDYRRKPVPEASLEGFQKEVPHAIGNSRHTTG
ncbi:MAG: glycosyltransferase family 2 protein [Xanthobacteraceae bacterium]